MNKKGQKTAEKMFRPAFGCCKHPKAGRNTQQLGQVLFTNQAIQFGGFSHSIHFALIPIPWCNIKDKPLTFVTSFMNSPLSDPLNWVFWHILKYYLFSISLSYRQLIKNEIFIYICTASKTTGIGQLKWKSGWLSTERSAVQFPVLPI